MFNWLKELFKKEERVEPKRHKIDLKEADIDDLRRLLAFTLSRVVWQSDDEIEVVLGKFMKEIK